MPDADASQIRRSSAFARKLAHFVELSPRDLSVIHDLESNRNQFPAGTDIVSPEVNRREIFILQQGWAVRYKSLPNGRRQVTNFVLPGDIIGIDSEMFCVPSFTVSCTTDASVSAIPTGQFLRAISQSADLLLAMGWCTVQEKSVICEHLLSVGRRSGEERVAHLLLEIHRRLEIVGVTRDGSFGLPVTQEMIGDALGLSVVHINRIMRQLRDQGLLHIDGHHNKRVRILDFSRLKRLAAFDDLFLCLTSMPRSIRFVIGRERDGSAAV